MLSGNNGDTLFQLSINAQWKQALPFLNIAFMGFGLTFEAFSELIQLFNIHEVFQNELEFQ